MTITCSSCHTTFESRPAPCPDGLPGCLTVHTDENSFVCPHCGTKTLPRIDILFEDVGIGVINYKSIVSLGILGVEDPVKTYWLSFVGLVDGQEHALGVVITEAISDTEAVQKISALGLNPGGEVLILEVPDEPEAQAEIAKFPKDTLLDPKTLLAAGCIKKGDVGEFDPTKEPVKVSTVCAECNPPTPNWLDITRAQVDAALPQNLDYSFIANVRPDFELGDALWARPDLEVTDVTRWPIGWSVARNPNGFFDPDNQPETAFPAHTRVFYVPAIEAWFAVSVDDFHAILDQEGLTRDQYAAYLLRKIKS